MMEQEFLEKLREAFAIESSEHVAAIRKGLADLEQGGGSFDQSIVDHVFREAHSLKGAARAVNREDIEALCQGMESLLALWKKDPTARDRRHFSLLDRGMELLEELLASEEEYSLSSEPLQSLVDEFKEESRNRTTAAINTPLPSIPQDLLENNALVEQLTEAAGNEASEPDESAALATQTSPGPEPAKKPHTCSVSPRRNGNTLSPSSSDSKESHKELKAGKQAQRDVSRDTVRVSTSELEALYRQTEELSSIKYMIGRSSADLKLVVDQCREWLREYQKFRQQSLEHVHGSGETGLSSPAQDEQYEKLLHFVKWTARQIESVDSSVGQAIEDGRGTMYIMDSLTDAMMDQAKQLLLLPFAILTDTLSPMVRKIARDLEKDVRFEVAGEDIRIDKRILEMLKDPLMHMLRNSLDHGIEEGPDRLREGKPEHGSISLRVALAQNNRVEIIVEDDGHGIDVDRLRNKAVAEGILTEESAAALDRRESLEMIFHPGLSTSQIITDLSGRGVGLNVVRENISALGGEVQVETEKGSGTRFTITLPVSLSNARGVLVRSSGRMYIVPLQHVDRGMVMHREDFRHIDGKSIIDYQDRTVCVQRLDEILAMPAAAKREEQTQVTLLILSLGGSFLGVEVDEVLWEQDVVVKPLPSPVARVRSIAGASLLSTGELVPVLHIPDLFDLARGPVTTPRSEKSATAETIVHRLLVVDDSITSRVLLHDILIGNGYSVKTAVDGIDALTCLREEEYSLIVSDVEMPRMNGFELTEAIRRDEKMHETPVVLVTGLESKADRERGFDVGANAYIIKSSFDQSNLLEVISRLL